MSDLLFTHCKGERCKPRTGVDIIYEPGVMPEPLPYPQVLHVELPVPRCGCFCAACRVVNDESVAAELDAIKTAWAASPLSKEARHAAQ